MSLFSSSIELAQWKSITDIPRVTYASWERDVSGRLTRRLRKPEQELAFYQSLDSSVLRNSRTTPSWRDIAVGPELQIDHDHAIPLPDKSLVRLFTAVVPDGHGGTRMLPFTTDIFSALDAERMITGGGMTLHYVDVSPSRLRQLKTVRRDGIAGYDGAEALGAPGLLNRYGGQSKRMSTYRLNAARRLALRALTCSTFSSMDGNRFAAGVTPRVMTR